MSAVKRLQFSTIIAAPVARVVALMFDPASYRSWTSAFIEGSTYEGSWAQGEREFEPCMNEAWPKAQARLRGLCDGRDAG